MILEKMLETELFTGTELHLIDFIHEHSNIVVNLSIEELSLKSNVSKTAIIRFCKKTGAKGFSDFKIQLAQELTQFALRDQNISVDIPIAPNASIAGIADTFYSLSRQALDVTKNNLDMTALSQAANMIALADVVHIYGRGESLILAEDFQYKLMRISKLCHLEPLNGFTENINRKPMNGSRIRECAIVISQYCNSTQIHYIIDELNLAHMPFILITAAKKIWPYDKYAKVVLRIECEESRNKMGCFFSRTAFLYILDCLYGIVFEKDYEMNKEHLLRCAKQKAAHNYYYTYLEDTDPN